jgi:hypothetical protein
MTAKRKGGVEKSLLTVVSAIYAREISALKGCDKRRSPDRFRSDLWRKRRYVSDKINWKKAILID